MTDRNAQIVIQDTRIAKAEAVLVATDTKYSTCLLGEGTLITFPIPFIGDGAFSRLCQALADEDINFDIAVAKCRLA